MYRTASELFQKLSGKRAGLITRTERYAALTIPKVCYPDGYNNITTDEAHDYQSIGSQAVTHLSNKLMLAMFAPSRPFAKLVPGKKTLLQAQSANIDEVALQDILSEGERKAVRELDSRAQRPKLFQLMRHLIVAGNALLCLDKKGIRIIGLKNYVVQRNIWGVEVHVVIRERLPFGELELSVRKLFANRYADDTQIEFFKWIKREDNGSYTMTQWVNESRLPAEYNGRWPAERLPYRAVTWDIGDEADYGTGLVEEYIGDFEALSVLSESVVDGAVLGSEFRWMVNPTGMTSVADLNNSENGDALPGVLQDVAPTQGGNPQAIETASTILDKYEKRVARGFLMGSAVIRDAERVTSEEVRLTANELETAYGSVYSTLAASVQLPVARWLFDSVDMKLAGSDIEVTIVTGLDALSRNGDLENLRLALSDLAGIGSVPPELAARIKWEPLTRFVGQGRSIDLSKFLLTDEEAAQKQQAQAEQRVGEDVAAQAGGAAMQQGPQ